MRSEEDTPAANSDAEDPATPADLALPHVRALHAYVPGAQPQGGGWTKLNTNECPYPPSPRVAAAVAAEVERLPRYPEPRSWPLREAVARHHGCGLGPDNVIVGNGSDDLLNLLVRTFCGEGRPAGMTLPSYSLYPVLTGIQGGELVEVPFGRGLELPVEAAAASGANLFFLASPNAPTGVGFPAAEVRRLAAAFPGILVVDEAYAAFAPENAVPLVAEFPRLVVTRTFSKSHGLAGLRVGYALASAGVIELLDRVRDSYNVNRLSQAGALAALEDTAYNEGVVARVIATRDAAAAALRERGWSTYPPAANFLFGAPRDGAGRTGPEVAAGCHGFLKANKVLVRYFPGHPLTAASLRISVGTDGEMQTLMETIDAWRTTTAAAGAGA